MTSFARFEFKTTKFSINLDGNQKMYVCFPNLKSFDTNCVFFLLLLVPPPKMNPP